MTPVSVHVLTGDDESILRAAVNALVQTLVGDGDRALMVDEFDAEDYTSGACRRRRPDGPVPHRATRRRRPRRRAVHRRRARRRSSATSPIRSPSTELVIEWGNQRRPKALDAALTGAGATIVSTTPPNRPRDRSAWVQAEAKSAGVRLNGAAVD